MAGSIDNPQRRGKHSLTGATRHKGGPILVVGNGPSLNETPLEEFADLPAIGMNKIDLLFSRTTWRPSLIVCVNNLVAQQNRAAFAAIDIPVFLAWKCRWFMGVQRADTCTILRIDRPWISQKTLRSGSRRMEVTLSLMGTQGVGWQGGEFTSQELAVTRNWLGGKALTIAGGSSEVQLNIIAKRVLGLPD
jgi:hypothetical protein